MYIEYFETRNRSDLKTELVPYDVANKVINHSNWNYWNQGRFVYNDRAQVFVPQRMSAFINEVANKLRGAVFLPTNNYPEVFESNGEEVKFYRTQNVYVFVGEEPLARGKLNYGYQTGNKGDSHTYNVSAPSIKNTKFTMRDRICCSTSKNLDKAVKTALQHFTAITPRHYYGALGQELKQLHDNATYQHRADIRRAYSDIAHDKLVDQLTQALEHDTLTAFDAEVREKIAKLKELKADAADDGGNKKCMIVMPTKDISGADIVLCAPHEMKTSIYSHHVPNNGRTYRTLDKIPAFIRDGVAKLNVLPRDEYHPKVGCTLVPDRNNAFVDIYWVEMTEDDERTWDESGW